MNQARWSPDDWIDAQSECNVDGYGNSRPRAAQHTRDLLSEGENRNDARAERIEEAMAQFHLSPGRKRARSH